jgi:hypothetical protein
MTEIPEQVVESWLRYYYAANSVGYLARHAKTDAYARTLSRAEPEALLQELRGCLEVIPETPAELIRPYILAMAAAHSGRVQKQDILNLNANFAKWFSEYVNIIFRSPQHVRASISGRTNIILGYSDAASSKMNSGSGTIILGHPK